MKAELEFEVAMSKPKYTLDEDILVRMYLFNLSDDDIVVNSRFSVNLRDFPGEVSLELVGPSGQPMPFIGRVNVGEPYPEDFSALVPWNFVGRQFELQSCIAIEEPGTYQLSANYRNEWSGQHLGLKAWTGSLCSNIVSFEVEE